jgi:hypothetical protein
MLILSLVAMLNGAGQGWQWDFEKDAIGARPAGFYCRKDGKGPSGKWEVVEDEGNHVLAQLDEHPARRRYALAIVEDVKVEHVDLSVRIKAIKGTEDQSGGVIWRYKNPENYLVARLDVTERNVRLFRFSDGNRVQIGVAGELDLKTEQWYTLRVEHRGGHIKVYLDGNIMFIKHDRHFHHPGRIGLWTKSHSVMYFDDLKAKDLDDDDDH